jgi:beta-1,4-N-acetylglucosaminyltransferase
MANSTGNLPNKRCFVTIGATAPFDKLIKAIFETDFLTALHEANYTELRVQYGKEGQTIYEEFFEKHGSNIKPRLNIDVTGFAFDKNGLEKEMRALKGKGGVLPGHVDPTEGTIISHAGTTGGSFVDSSVADSI